MFRPQILGRSGPAITVSFLSNLLFSYYLHIYILYEIYRIQTLILCSSFHYKKKKEKTKNRFFSVVERSNYIYIDIFLNRVINGFVCFFLFLVIDIYVHACIFFFFFVVSVVWNERKRMQHGRGG